MQPRAPAFYGFPASGKVTQGDACIDRPRWLRGWLFYVWGKSDQMQANSANHALYAHSVDQYPCGFAGIA